MKNEADDEVHSLRTCYEQHAAVEEQPRTIPVQNSAIDE